MGMEKQGHVYLGSFQPQFRVTYLEAVLLIMHGIINGLHVTFLAENMLVGNTFIIGLSVSRD